MQAQLAVLVIQRAMNESTYDELHLEYKSLKAQHQEVLARCDEIHTQIRSRSQSKPERDQLRTRSHTLGEEAERLRAKILDCEATESVLTDEWEELGAKIKETRKQLAG